MKILLLLLLSYANCIQINDCNEVWTTTNNLYSMKFYACFEPIQIINPLNIAQNTFNITQNTFNITQNTSNITQNTFNITHNPSNITHNTSNITQNTSTITQNHSKIKSLSPSPRASSPSPQPSPTTSPSPQATQAISPSPMTAAIKQELIKEQIDITNAGLSKNMTKNITKNTTESYDSLPIIIISISLVLVIIIIILFIKNYYYKKNKIEGLTKNLSERVSKTIPVKKFVQQYSVKTNETEIQKPKEQKNDKPILPKRKLYNRKLPPLPYEREIQKKENPKLPKRKIPSPPPENDIEMG